MIPGGSCQKLLSKLSDFINIFHSRLCLKNRRPSADVGILQCLKYRSLDNVYRNPMVKISFLYQIHYLFGD